MEMSLITERRRYSPEEKKHKTKYIKRTTMTINYYDDKNVREDVKLRKRAVVPPSVGNAAHNCADKSKLEKAQKDIKLSRETVAPPPVGNAAHI